jgi:hypothetical protein
MKINKVLILVFFLLAINCLTSFQTGIPQSKDLYLHKIKLIDSTGKEIKEGWKLGINGHKKYTFVTPNDSNVIVKVDSLSQIIIFYNNKAITYFFLSDLKSCKKNNLENQTFNLNYEYMFFIQFAKQKCANSASLVLGKNVNSITYNKEKDPWGLSKITISSCDNKICFWGNSDFKKDLTQKYKRLKNVY